MTRFWVAVLIAVCLLAAAWAKAASAPPHVQQVAILNQSVTVPQAELAADLPVFQQLVDDYLGPAWNLQAHLYLGSPKPGSDVVYIEDVDTHHCQCLGYHDWRQDRGVAYVYALDANPDPGWPAVVSHELEEMLVDPSIDRVVASAGLNDPQPSVMWMVEVADPVVDARLRIGGLALADFVLPAWFETRLRYKHRFDAAGAVTVPFGTTARGYAWMFSNGGWGSYPMMGLRAFRIGAPLQITTG